MTNKEKTMLKNHFIFMKLIATFVVKMELLYCVEVALRNIVSLFIIILYVKENIRRRFL